MVKNIIGLLLGLSILGYGGYYSTRFAIAASKTKPLFTSSNIDLSEEKWVKPLPPPKPQVQAPASPPPVRKAPKGKQKKSSPKKQESCEIGSSGGGSRRFRVQVTGGTLQCKGKSQ